jgi:hypothetical protein
VGEHARSGAGHREEEELTPAHESQQPLRQNGCDRHGDIAVPVAIVAYAATLISLGWMLSARAK